jgi:hypothetical protein
MAAWCSGGFRYRPDEPHGCKVKQNFGRDKPAIAPNCTLHEVLFSILAVQSTITYKHTFFLVLSNLSKYTVSNIFVKTVHAVNSWQIFRQYSH